MPTAPRSTRLSNRAAYTWAMEAIDGARGVGCASAVNRSGVCPFGRLVIPTELEHGQRGPRDQHAQDGRRRELTAQRRTGGREDRRSTRHRIRVRGQLPGGSDRKLHPRCCESVVDAEAFVRSPRRGKVRRVEHHRRGLDGRPGTPNDGSSGDVVVVGSVVVVGELPSSAGPTDAAQPRDRVTARSVSAPCLMAQVPRRPPSAPPWRVPLLRSSSCATLPTPQGSEAGSS